MSTSRRNFLRAGTSAVLFAGLSVNPLKLAFAQSVGRNFEIPQEAKRDRVFYFTRSTFEPHLNTQFKVVAGAYVTSLRLIEVENCAPRGAAGECFTLTFSADQELSPVRTIHVFEHGALGEFNLFVSQTTKMKDPEGVYYVAVINHITAASPER